MEALGKWGTRDRSVDHFLIPYSSTLGTPVQNGTPAPLTHEGDVMLADGIINIRVNENGDDRDAASTATETGGGAPTDAGSSDRNDGAALTNGDVANGHSGSSAHTRNGDDSSAAGVPEANRGGAIPKQSSTPVPPVPPRPKEKHRRSHAPAHQNSVDSRSAGDSATAAAPAATSPSQTPPHTSAGPSNNEASQVADPSASDGSKSGRDTIASTPAVATRASADEEPLPAGWEMRYDQFGRKYYVDHNTKSTTWERPTNAPLPAG